MSTFRFAVAAVVLSLASLAAAAQDKVVYHVNDTQSQAQITVVTHAFGVDFLLEGMKDRNETSFDATVAALKNRGVKFEVCEITLKNRNLKREQFIPEADFTPSGVVRLTRLQLQGHAYIKP